MSELRDQVQSIVHFAIPSVGETYDVRGRATVQVVISNHVEAYVRRHFITKGTAISKPLSRDEKVELLHKIDVACIAARIEGTKGQRETHWAAEQKAFLRRIAEIIKDAPVEGQADATGDEPFDVIARSYVRLGDILFTDLSDEDQSTFLDVRGDLQQYIAGLPATYSNTSPEPPHAKEQG